MSYAPLNSLATYYSLHTLTPSQLVTRRALSAMALDHPSVENAPKGSQEMRRVYVKVCQRSCDYHMLVT